MKCPNYQRNKCTTHGEINPAQIMGAIKSDKKAVASRINGLKGGRPKGSKNKIKKVMFYCDDCGAHWIEFVPNDIEVNCNIGICSECINE